MKTITKITAFVIFALFASMVTSCEDLRNATNTSNSANEVSAFYSPKIVGKITSDEIKESSGLAASKCRTDILWTHNDSGDGPFIYALDLKGNRLETWKVKEAKNVDWEDIALRRDADGKCYLYIGDTGNNTRSRSEFTIYRVLEPTVSAKSSSKKDPGETRSAEVLRFSYPDNRHDAETLMVEPLSGSIYVLSKRISGASGVYKLDPEFDPADIQTAKKLTDITVPAIPNGFLTGGDISPDGKRAVLCDYFAGYELTLKDGQSFDDIWNNPPIKFSLGQRDQGEAIAYSSDGSSIFATSEFKNSPLIRVSVK